MRGRLRRRTSKSDYGPLPNIQLAVIAPMMRSVRPPIGPNNYGYGDTQLGLKFHFVQEGEWRPQIATYPQLEIPTGSRVSKPRQRKRTDVFLPLWLQKSVGKWTAYGGGGISDEKNPGSW